MGTQELPATVKALMRQIETHEQLDAVLVIASDPSRLWTLEEVMGRTRLSQEMAEASLEGLVRQGLLVSAPEGWRLPSDPHLLEALEQLAAHYRDNLVAIIRELTENALARVRTKALRTFADAFVVKRRDGE